MKSIRDNQVEILNTEDIWSQFGKPLPPEGPKANNQRLKQHGGRWTKPTLAALFTLSIHSLLLAPLVLGTPGRKYRPPLTEGASASAESSEASEFVSTLIFINSRSITPLDQTDDSAYTVIKEAEKAAEQISSMAEIAAVSQPEVAGSEESKDDDSTMNEAVGDEAGRALLFGRYLSQIKARIERAWEYPTQFSKEKFQCKVQIAQSEHGDVREVTLQHCNSSAAWQTSLVRAIQRASPLPAPPSEKVFTSVLTMTFEANPKMHLQSLAGNANSEEFANGVE